MSEKTNGLRLVQPTPIFDGRPPQCLGSEQAVLGCCLLARIGVEKARELLKTSDFYHDAHRLIFEAILTVAETVDIPDVISVSDVLKTRGQYEQTGGERYLLILLEAPSTAYNIEVYCAQVKEKSTLRELIDVGNLITGIAFETSDDTAAQRLKRAQELVLSIKDPTPRADITSMERRVHAAYDRIDQRRENPRGRTGLSTGFLDLDFQTGGLQKSDLFVIGASPSMGKTTLAMQMAASAAMGDRVPVAVFSLEMSADQLIDKMISSESRVDTQHIRTGNLTEADYANLAAHAHRIATAPLHIDDTSALTVADIHARATRIKAEHGLGLVVIDYLQLIRLPDRVDNRAAAFGDIAKSLKALAKDLAVPVVVLSQLSRSVSARTDKRPVMSDLKESGDIEAAADVILFLYRDSYYSPKNVVEEREEGAPVALDLTELIIAKHRNGPTGKVVVGFSPAIARFENLLNNGRVEY